MAQAAEIVLEVKEKNTEAIEKVNSQLRETEAASAKTSAGLVALGVAAVAATATIGKLAAEFASAMGELLDYTEKLEKANQSTGVSIELWQKLIKTGEEMGIGFDQMRTMVERMEKSLEGSGTTLRRFGIDVEDFKKLEADEALRKMAAQIVAIEDPMVRAAAAQAVFNRSGAEMIPILVAIVNGSVDAQKALGPGMVASLAQSEQALKHVGTEWRNLKEETLALIATKLPLDTFFAVASDSLRLLGRLAQDGGTSLKFLGQMALLNIPGAVLTIKQFAESETQVETQTHKTSAAVLGMMETQRKLRIALDELVAVWAKEEAASKKAEEQARKQERARQAEVKAFERAEDAARKYAMDSEAALIKSWRDIDTAAAAHTRRMMQEEETQLAEARRRWGEEARLAIQSYDQQTFAAHANFFKTRAELEQTAVVAEAAYRQMLAAGVASFEQLRAAHAAWKQAEADLNAKSAVSTIQGFELIASSASSILRSLFGKSKAAAIAAAIIDTFAAVAKTLAAYPWPWSLVPAAAALAAGYAQVNKIRSQEAGFAQGTPGTSFVDFGPGTPAMLHGQEAVVTRAQGETLAAMVREAIDGAGKRGGQARRAVSRGEPIHVHLHVDGKQMADVDVRRNKAGLAPMRAT